MASSEDEKKSLVETATNVQSREHHVNYLVREHLYLTWWWSFTSQTQHKSSNKAATQEDSKITYVLVLCVMAAALGSSAQFGFNSGVINSIQNVWLSHFINYVRLCIYIYIPLSLSFL